MDVRCDDCLSVSQAERISPTEVVFTCPMCGPASVKHEPFVVNGPGTSVLVEQD